jgi:hypothetical protein
MRSAKNIPDSIDTDRKIWILIDSTRQSIQDSLTQLQILQEAETFVAKIQCLHTGIEVAGRIQDILMLPILCCR